MTEAYARRAAARIGVIGAALILIAACSERRDPHADQSVQVVRGAPAAPPLAIVATRQLRPVPIPAASTTHVALARVAVPHKSFADPPLPPELRDDGGLTPLPPRPAPAAMATALHPMFTGAASSATGEERP